jgi:hypothetical protein
VTQARPIKWTDEVKRVKVNKQSHRIKITIIEHSKDLDYSEETGSITIPYSALILNTGVDEWFEALSEKGRTVGKIHLITDWVPSDGVRNSN